MNKQTKKGIIVSIAVIAITASVIYYTNRAKKDKAWYAAKIAADPRAGITTPDAAATIAGYDDQYVRAWYDAIQNNQPTFSVRGLMYNTMGGRRKQ